MNYRRNSGADMSSLLFLALQIFLFIIGCGGF